MEAIKDYYHILGVRPDSSQEDIKRAYTELAKLRHPDRFVTEEEKLNIDTTFAEISEAYNCLKDPAKREVYNIDKKLWEKIQSLSDDEIARVFHRKAMQILDEARDMDLTQSEDAPIIKKDKVRTVIRLLSFSTDKADQNSVYWCDLGLAYLADGQRPKAKELILKAIKMEEFHPEFHHALAKTYLDAGAVGLAKKSLHEALRWDSTYEPARQALADLGEKESIKWDFLPKQISKQHLVLIIVLIVVIIYRIFFFE
jgi:curved DNA-binding protein CbpA